MSDWFRNETWSSEIEHHFFDKLGRARSQKLQYLRIQAHYLRQTAPEKTLSLLEHYFSFSDQVDKAQAYVDQAHAYATLGNIESAARSYEDALLREESFPNYLTPARFEFPLFIAQHKLSNRYKEALSLIEKSRTEAVFPIDKFRNASAEAFISEYLDLKKRARASAQSALKAADMGSPFPRHRGLGLVGPEHDELKGQLREIIEPKTRLSIFDRLTRKSRLN